MQILLLNGAPHSGKDAIAKHLVKNGYGHYKMTTPIDNAIRALFNLSDKGYKNVREKDKESPNTLLAGRCMRETWIWFGEECKKFFNPNIFADIATRNIDDIASNRVVVSDIGFHIEAKAIIDYFGKENVFGINVVREGCHFDGDSRKFIDFGIYGIRHKVFNNCFPNLEFLGMAIDEEIIPWLPSTRKIVYIKDEQ